MGDVSIRFRTDGGRGVKRALRGVTRDVERSERKQQRAAERTTREQRDEWRDRQRNVRRGTRQQVRAWERAERSKRRAMQETTREAQRNIRQVTRAEERAARQRRRRPGGDGGGRQGGRRGGRGAAAAGAAAGAAVGAIGVGRSAQGTLGIRSQEELITAALGSRSAIIRAAQAAGLDAAQQQQVLERSAQIGREERVSTESVLQAVGLSQELFSGLGNAAARGEEGLDDLFQNLQFMARVSRATGSEMSDVVGAAGEFSRQMGLSAGETREALAIIAQGANDGSLSLRDFAGSFPEALSSLTAARGSEGVGTAGVREFAAMAQALRASGFKADQSRTAMQQLLAQFADAGVQENLREAGVEVTQIDPETGQRVLRNTADIIDEISRNDSLQTLTQIKEAVPSEEAARGLTGLVSQERRSREEGSDDLSLRERQNVSSAEGSQFIDDTIQALNQDVSGETARLAAEREANIFTDSEELIGGFNEVADLSTSIEDKFPMLTQAIENMSGIIGPALAGGLLGNLFGGGGGGGSFLGRLFGGGGATAAGGAAASGGSSGGLSGALAAIGGGSAILGGLTVAGAGLGIGGIVEGTRRSIARDEAADAANERRRGVSSAATEALAGGDFERGQALLGRERALLQGNVPGGAAGGVPQAALFAGVGEQLGGEGAAAATEEQTAQLREELREQSRHLGRIATATERQASRGDADTEL